MVLEIDRLIAEARVLAGDDLCAGGHHAWESEGGRHCPEDFPVDCSQPVYRCARCGEYDYGEKGGPGYHDCQTLCKWRGHVTAVQEQE